MKILLIYATNSGSTSLAGCIIRDVLAKKYNVVVKKTVEVDPSELEKYGAIIFGSPSWDFEGKEGQPHQTMLVLMEKLKGTNFSGKPCAVYGCGDTSYTHFCGAVDELEKFVAAEGGKLVMDSLRIDGYYFDLQKNEERVGQWAGALVNSLK